MDGHRAHQAREKNMYTSFTYGRSPSASRVVYRESESSLEISDGNLEPIPSKSL